MMEHMNACFAVSFVFAHFFECKRNDGDSLLITSYK